VFRSARDASLAVVVANYSMDEEVVVDVVTDGAAVAGSCRLVDGPGWQPAAGGVGVPPRSAAVVLGQRMG
jgi:hypothetical protein